LDDMLKSVTPDQARGRDVTVREVLDTVAGRIDDELADAPAVEATVRLILGQTYHELGAFTEAATMLEQAAAIHANMGLETAETAQIYRTLGGARLAQEDLDAAEEDFDRALAIARAAEGAESDSVLAILNQRGQILYRRGQFEEVAATLREVIRIFAARYGESSRELQSARGNLGMVLMQSGARDEADQLLTGAHDWFLREDGPASSMVLALLDGRASIAVERGDFDQAVALSREALERCREHFGPRHPEVADTLFMYGTRLASGFRTADAEPVFREAVSIREEHFGPDSLPVAEVLGRLGPVLSDLHRIDEALAVQERALSIYRQHEDASAIRFGWTLHGYALTLLDARRFAEARVAEEEAIALLSEPYSADSSQVLILRGTLAFIDQSAGDFRAARAAHQEVVAARQDLLGPDHPDTVLSQLCVAECEFGLGDIRIALQQLEAVVPRAAHAYGADSAMGAGARAWLALARLQDGAACAARPPAEAAYRFYHDAATATAVERVYAAALVAAAAHEPGAGDVPAVQALLVQRPAILAAASEPNAGDWRLGYAAFTAGRLGAASEDPVVTAALLDYGARLLADYFGPDHPLSRAAAEARATFATAAAPEP
ncbi:MAG: tetratricopeptide repeat protein, partial [Phycisphaerae bacterium]|nr:tetratricopeptide repeat protein [Phycisphaerae bacterium]